MSECRAEVYTFKRGLVHVPATKSPSGQLFVHRDLDAGVGGYGEWAISHEQTGYRVGSFATMRAAVKCAESLDHLDWANPQGLRSLVHDAVGRWGGYLGDVTGPLSHDI